MRAVSKIGAPWVVQSIQGNRGKYPAQTGGVHPSRRPSFRLSVVGAVSYPQRGYLMTDLHHSSALLRHCCLRYQLAYAHGWWGQYTAALATTSTAHSGNRTPYLESPPGLPELPANVHVKWCSSFRAVIGSRLLEDRTHFFTCRFVSRALRHLPGKPAWFTLTALLHHAPRLDSSHRHRCTNCWSWIIPHQLQIAKLEVVDRLDVGIQQQRRQRPGRAIQ